MYFANPKAVVLYIDQSGSSGKAAWGRRNREEMERSSIPVTGWARIESVKEGKWNRFKPEKIFIKPLSYMEKDAQKNSCWFELAEKEYIAALLIREETRNTAYIITVPTPQEFAHIHHRWPMILNKEFT
ncbi:hypothetical protein [Limisalsivibrio acetivorans]|uniref:hypothetical protein n=1 Tax=Limisalsivibrio acetivorans TaxID=1304888 RepID=UPI0003B3BE08|nr:hypothetical protein [Limisalsivibrio acetivorans]